MPFKGANYATRVNHVPRHAVQPRQHPARWALSVYREAAHALITGLREGFQVLLSA